MSRESKHKPKGHFFIGLPEDEYQPNHYLFLTIWPVKKDPATEVLVARIAKRFGPDSWSPVAKIAALRTPDGKFKKLPRWQPANEAMGWIDEFEEVTEQ